MKFKKNQKYYYIFLIMIIGSIFANIANASDIIFYNNSKYILSIAKYMDVCSNEIGDIPSFTKKTVTEAQFNEVCAHKPKECYLKLYSGAGCTGKLQAYLLFQYTKLIRVDYPTSGTNFSIGYDGTMIYFNGMS